MRMTIDQAWQQGTIWQRDYFGLCITVQLSEFIIGNQAADQFVFDQHGEILQYFEVSIYGHNPARLEDLVAVLHSRTLQDFGSAENE